jgi:hypothetical protein
VPRLAVLLALLAAVQIACGPKSTTIQYRLPLAGNPGADGCHATCQGVRASDGDDAFLDCLAACPGAEVTPDSQCDYSFAEHNPPAAVCVTAKSTKTGGRPIRAGLIIAGVVLVLYGLAVVLADSIDPIDRGSDGQ